MDKLTNFLQAFPKSLTRTLLAFIWTFAAIGYVYLVTVSNIPESNIRIVDTVLGFILGTIVATIINYFFGSSQGSADKNELLKDNK
jgi:uncharacterized membrane protein required for colicin V production